MRLFAYISTMKTIVILMLFSLACVFAGPRPFDTEATQRQLGDKTLLILSSRPNSEKEATQRQLSHKTLLILSSRPNSEKEAGTKNLLHFAVNLGEPVDCAEFLEQNLKRSTFKLCFSLSLIQ
ncbi:uncharacterized protein LOC144654071 [Oculina patagonica]